MASWFTPQPRRRRRRSSGSIWRTPAWYVFLTCFAFLLAATWTLDYLPGVVSGTYRLQPLGLAVALIAPGLVTVFGFLAYRRIQRRYRAAASARPAAPLATSRVPIPAGLRFTVLRRDGFRCAYCGRGEPEGVRLHIDHLVPVARGGATQLDNLITACADCNLGKSASDLVGEDEPAPATSNV